MAKSSNQKLKLLYLLKTLNEKTDEENTLTINDMILECECQRKCLPLDNELVYHQ